MRHDKEARSLGLIDSAGYREVEELIENHGFTKEILDEIVMTNNKQRFEYDIYREYIRARQGHSIDVEIPLELVTDCDVLWHGTSDRFIEAIKKEGIKKMSRLYVHMTPDQETAKKVGKRHGGDLVIIEINAKQMVKDGVQIFKSSNGVYLTDYVDPKYFINII